MYADLSRMCCVFKEQLLVPTTTTTPWCSVLVLITPIFTPLPLKSFYPQPPPISLPSIHSLSFYLLLIVLPLTTNPLHSPPPCPIREYLLGHSPLSFWPSIPAALVFYRPTPLFSSQLPAWNYCSSLYESPFSFITTVNRN